MEELTEMFGYEEGRGTVLSGKHILFLLVLIASALTTSAVYAESCHRTGTFSTLYYNQEGGDWLGEEVRIVYTKFGFVGTYQIAEGTPYKLEVFPVVFDGCNLSFSFKMYEDSVQFKGKIMNSTLEGDRIWNDGVRGKLSLPRKQSYWD